MTDGWGISCKIALRWIPLDLTGDKSTLVQVMAWCRQATSHYLNQCWPRSLPPYGVTRPQWVNEVSHVTLLSNLLKTHVFIEINCIKCTISYICSVATLLILNKTRPDNLLGPTITSWHHECWTLLTLIARFMGPTWGPSGANMTQVGLMLAISLRMLQISILDMRLNITNLIV